MATATMNGSKAGENIKSAIPSIDESLIENPIAAAVVKLLVLCGKMVGLCVFAQFIRWTIPRFRFDQLMNLGWKVMIPLALLNLVAVMFVKQFGFLLLTLTGVSARCVQVDLSGHPTTHSGACP